MRDYEREGVQPETALEALREIYTNEDLSQFVRSAIGPKPPTRKDDMLALLAPLVQGEELRRTWGKLTAEEKAKVAQTAWSKTGFFDAYKFAATKEKAAFDDEDDDAEGEAEEEDEEPVGRKAKKSLLGLIMPRGIMSREVQKALREFVPKPKRSTVGAVEKLPETVEMPWYDWNYVTGKSEKQIKQVPVVVREMERAALHDVTAVLRLVDTGALAVTDKNRWPTPAAMRRVEQVLEGGDYFPDEKPEKEKKKKKNEYEYEEERPGPVRAFAWPMILQAGKLAQVRGSKLELTKAGRKALGVPPHETLKELWQRWKDTDVLDELRRINVIRGQTGNGRRYLTKPAERREAIAAALRECPVGRWVLIEELGRHMRAAGHDFEVTSSSWTLYISEQQYGSLAGAGSGEWKVLQFRYMLAVLMEYAATLGLVDVAYIPPEGARGDYGGLWGTDDLAFFSRYDGLMYLRLARLGAYELGLSETYSPPPVQTRQVIRVDPELEVVATGALSPADVLLLDSFAEKVREGVWKLTPPKILDAGASGRSMNELVEFLESASGEELPEPVERLFAEVSARANVLQDLGPARLIGCADAKLATFIAHHTTTGKLCALAGADRLVVASKDEAAFYRALKKLGFVPRRGAGGE